MADSFTKLGAPQWGRDYLSLSRSLQAKTIFVTGAAGFIGSHLCEALLSLGARVRGLDNFSTGKRSHLGNALSNPLFSFREGDVVDLPQNLEWLAGCDAICHQAALGSVPRSIENPLVTHHSNSTGFLAVLEAAKKTHISRIVYASSSSVYGDFADSPKKEALLGDPLSPYAVSKLTNEFYAGVYYRLFGLETLGLRYFNVFGSRQDPEGPYAAVIPRFFQELFSLRSPVIFGDGRQSRDFTHVSNAVYANLLALTTTQNNAYGETFNVGCGTSISVVELFEKIQKIAAKRNPHLQAQISQLSPLFSEPRKGDVLNSLSSLEKIQALLGYHPITSLEEGLEEASLWYKEVALRPGAQEILL